MEIVIPIITLIIGYCICFFVVKMGVKRREYVGNIVVIKDPDAPVHGKKIYSLEINDNPEIIETKDEVVFKVLVPDVESDRR